MSEIAISNVSKWYGTKKKGKYSVKDLNLKVEKGSVFGFLGPNGAGKTTTMKMVVGLAKPTHGHIKLAGGSGDDVSIRKKIGFMPESPSFYLYLTGCEFLEFIADIFGIKNSKVHINEVLSSVDLLQAGNKQIRTYSKGMIQRLGLAQALINDPEILFLDEATSHLDLITEKRVNAALSKLNITQVMVAHRLETIRMADRVIELSGGKIQC